MRYKGNSATRRISMTLLVSISAMAINYLISLLLTPYITTYIGTDAYGFVSLAKTISNYGIIITGALNAYAARYITLAYHEGNLRKANRYFSSVVINNIGLLVAILIFEVFFIWKLQIFIKIPSNLITEVKILFAMDITNYMLLTLANVFTVSAYIKNHLYRMDLIKLLSYLVEAVVLVILFHFFPARIYYVGIGLLVSTFVLGFGNYIRCRKDTPELKVNGKLFSWNAVKDLIISGVWNSINSIGNLLNSGLDLWVSNLMLSAISMGELSIVRTVSTIVSSLEQLVSRPFQPYLLKKYQEKDKEGVIRIFNLQIKFSGYISNMICAGLITFGGLYYKLWVSGQNIELLYGITLVTVAGFVAEGMIQPLFYTYTLTLQNKIPCFVTIASGFLNVFGMYILLKTTNLGLYAVVGTTTVLGFFTYMIFTPIYTAYCLGVKWNIFYLSIFRVLISECLIILVLRLIFSKFMPSTWLGLGIGSIVSCVIGLPIHMLCVVNKDELLLFKNQLKRKEK